MRSIFLTLIATLPVLSGACAGQISDLPSWDSFGEDSIQGENDFAVVVLGVEPAARVLLAYGRIEKGGWSGKSTPVWLSAKDGFVVARLTPTRDDLSYAVVQVCPGRRVGAKEGAAPTYETGFWSALPAGAAPGQCSDGVAYGPTGNARVPVLEAIMGRVAFAGTIRIDALGERDADAAPQKVGLTPTTSPDDIDAVRRFMAQHYPKVTARVVSRPLQMIRRGESGD
jgi:hypothetical protein